MGLGTQEVETGRSLWVQNKQTMPARATQWQGSHKEHMNYNLDMYLSDLKIYVYVKLLPMGISEMAQWVKVLAIKPNKPSLVLRTHMVEGEKW